MEDLDLRQLRAFVTLARVGSFTRAAALLHVTQSAVSHGMRRLETQVGCALFYKKGKTPHLTPEGRVLLGHALRLLDDVERAANALRGRVTDVRGTMSVVFSTSMAHLILAPVLREFRESYPRMSVSVRLQDTPQALQEIEEGRCDLALVVEDQFPAGLKKHYLFCDELSFVFSPRHPWTEKASIDGDDIAKEHFLLYQRNSVTFRRQEEFFLRMGVQPASYVEIASFEIMTQLARLGLGVAFSAPWVVERELREGSLVMKPLPKFPIHRRWIVVHQGNRALRQTEQTFIGLCRMACQGVPALPIPVSEARAPEAGARPAPRKKPRRQIEK